MNVERYHDGDGRLLALVLRAGPPEPGVHFATAPELPLQVGRLCHPAGRVIAAHVHEPYPRTVQATTEVIVVVKGRLRVDLFGTDGWEIQHAEIAAGEAVVLLGGAHGFEVIEDLEAYECKQGPYSGELDKVRL